MLFPPHLGCECCRLAVPQSIGFRGPFRNGTCVYGCVLGASADSIISFDTRGSDGHVGFSLKGNDLLAPQLNLITFHIHF